MLPSHGVWSPIFLYELISDDIDGLSAYVLNTGADEDPYKLIVQGEDTGADNTIAFNTAGLTGSGTATSPIPTSGRSQTSWSNWLGRSRARIGATRNWTAARTNSSSPNLISSWPPQARKRPHGAQAARAGSPRSFNSLGH